MKTLMINPFWRLLSDRSIPVDIRVSSLLVIFLPVVLITGPALPDIFLSLVACYFLIKSILSKSWSYYKNPFVIGFLLFSAYGILRSLFYESPWQSLSNEGSVFYFRYIFFSLGVWYLLNNNPYLSKCIIRVSILCIILISLNSIFQYFVGYDLLGNDKHNYYRLTLLGQKEPITGRYIALLSLFTLCLLSRYIRYSLKLTILYLILLAISNVVVFLSGERAPLSYMFSFTVLIMLFSNFRFKIFLSFVSICLTVIIITLLNPIAKERIFNYTLSKMDESRIKYLPIGNGYENHFISSFKIFYNNPVFGIGTNSFRFQCNKLEYISYYDHNCPTHPHNYYLQILAEMGIVGFLFVISFFLYFCYKVSSRFFYQFLINSNSKTLLPFYKFTYFLILCIYWFPLMTHMSFYNNWNNVIPMLTLGFFMKYVYVKKT